MTAFTDNFTESSNTNLENHTPSGGTAWTLASGSAGAILVIAATDVIRPAGAGVYTCDDKGSADHYAKIKITGFSGRSDYYLAARLVDGSNLIGWRLAGTGAAGSRFTKVVAGTATDLVSFQGAVNDVYTITCSGNTITGTQNTTDKYSGTVTDHNTETSSGLVAGSNDVNVSFDLFEHDALAATGVVGPLISENRLVGVGILNESRLLS